jgi:hypothetical protein
VGLPSANPSGFMWPLKSKLFTHEILMHLNTQTQYDNNSLLLDSSAFRSSLTNIKPSK